MNTNKIRNRKAQNIKQEGQRKRYGENGIYQQWQDYNANNEYMPFAKYREIIKSYNKKIGNVIVEGGKIKVHNLGDLFVQKVDRNFNKTVIDWKKSKEIGKTVYHTDDYYVMFKWRKCKMYGNHIFYKFIASRGENSLVKKLISKMKMPLQHLKYIGTNIIKHIEKRKPTGELEATYLTVKELLECNPNVSYATIKKVANNPSNTHKGYTWNIIT